MAQDVMLLQPQGLLHGCQLIHKHVHADVLLGWPSVLARQKGLPAPNLHHHAHQVADSHCLNYTATSVTAKKWLPCY